MLARALSLPIALLAACGGVTAAVDASVADAPRTSDVAAPVGAQRCADATLARDGSTFTEGSLDGAERGAGCLGAVRSVAYRVTVGPREVLRAEVREADGPVVLQVIEDCAATRCLAQSSTSGVTPLRALWRNEGDAPREVRVLAGSFSSWAGRFTVSFSLTPAASNLRCEDAEALEEGAWRGEQEFGPEAAPATLCESTQSPAAAGLRWYRVTIPPRAVAVATVTPGPNPPGRSFGVAAVMRERCDERACLAATPTLLRARSSLVGANDSDAPREVRVGVGVYPPQADGRFSLAFATHPIDRATRCEDAEALTEGVEARGDTALSATTIPLCGGQSLGGAVRFHRFEIPPRRFLELRGATSGGAALALRALSSCADPRCVADGGSSATPIVRLPNDSDAPRAVTIAVGAREPDRRAPYTLTATTLGPDAAGRCEAAQEITARSVATNTFTVAGAGPACDGAEALGPSRWFRVTVPALTAMRFTAGAIAHEGRAVPVALRVLSGCGVSECLARGEGQVVWGNAEETPRELWVAAGAREAGVRGAFTLYAYPQAIAANSRCDRATPLTLGATVSREQSGQSLVSAPWCEGEPRASRWYGVTVPPGEVLHVWAKNPFSNFSSGMPALALRGSCDGACVAIGGAPGSRGSHLWWHNEGAEARAVVVQAGWSALAGNYYDIVSERLAAAPTRCDTAEGLALPSSLSIPALRGAAEATRCASENRSPVRWFRVEVPAGRALSLRAAATALSPPQQLALGVHAACDGECIAPIRGASRVALSWRNEAFTPRVVWVSLHAADDAPLTGITLDASLE